MGENKSMPEGKTNSFGFPLPFFVSPGFVSVACAHATCEYDQVSDQALEQFWVGCPQVDDEEHEDGCDQECEQHGVPSALRRVFQSSFAVLVGGIDELCYVLGGYLLVDGVWDWAALHLCHH